MDTEGQLYNVSKSAKQNKEKRHRGQYWQTDQLITIYVTNLHFSSIKHSYLRWKSQNLLILLESSSWKGMLYQVVYLE